MLGMAIELASFVTVQEVKECMSVLDDMTTFMILLIILKIDLVINKYRT